MGSQNLNKEQAYELITPVIDGEASVDERKAFMKFIEQNEEVRSEFESLQQIKSVVKSRCPRATAPESLRDYVKTIAHQEADLDDMPGGGSVADGEDPQQHRTPTRKLNYWIYSAAAVLLVTVLLWGYFDNNSANQAAQASIFNVEEYVYEHFTKHDGQFIEPTIATASLGSAEIQLANNYGMTMTIPELEKAEFRGVVYSEFVPNFKAPMLEYYISSENQYVYIFAFDLKKMKEFGKLGRHEDAVKKCDKPKDFHIRNVNGKHVVSWKWNDIWYAAISNHNGNTLASLVKPLQYNPEGK